VATKLQLIIIIIIIIIISFMQGIYTYIPEKNYVPRDYSVASILFLLFMVLISLVSVLIIIVIIIKRYQVSEENDGLRDIRQVPG
jgi:hypothetical protein